MFGAETNRVAEAVEILAGADLDVLSDAGLCEDVVALSAEIGRLRAQLSRRVAVWDGRVAWTADGQRSGAGWLAHHTGCSRAQGRQQVRVARRLRDLPALCAAVEAGELSWEQAGTLALAASDASFDSFKEVEAVLVESCRELSVAETKRVAQYWRHLAVPDDEAALADAQHVGRELYVSKTLDGTYALGGSLDGDGGRTLEAALHRLMDSARARERQAAEDGVDDLPKRTTAQRRADALVDLGRLALGWDAERDDTDLQVAIDGPPRHHVEVVVDAETLADNSGTLAEYADGTPFLSETARRHACDGGLFRLVTDTAAVPLDLGRQTRIPSRAIRRAVAFRDGGCCFPGCGAPARLCDVHHVEHWSRGGPTSVDNCALLCWFHHRLVHEGGWAMAVDKNTARPVFTSPDHRQFHSTNPRRAQPRQLAAALKPG